MWAYTKATFKEFVAHEPIRLGAIVAYFAIIALPGLLVVVINTVGAIWGNDLAEGEINDQIEEWFGTDQATYVRDMVNDIQFSEQSTLATILAIAVLIFAASGVFYHLQLSLNDMWSIKQRPKSNALKLLIDRVVSFGFVMAIAFLLMVSFIASALLTILSGFLKEIWEPAYVVFVQISDFVISTAGITLLIGLMFRFLPDARVGWRLIWRGALVTAVLFNLGVYLLGLFFRIAEPGTLYGAAGSVIIFLLWVSYTCMILFLGAAMIRVYAERYGEGIIPARNAIKVSYQSVVSAAGHPHNNKDHKLQGIRAGSK